MAAITVSNLTKSFPAAESRAGGFFARLWPVRPHPRGHGRARPQLLDRRGRARRLHRSQRRRQVDHAQDADRHPRADLGHRRGRGLRAVAPAPPARLRDRHRVRPALAALASAARAGRASTCWASSTVSTRRPTPCAWQRLAERFDIGALLERRAAELSLGQRLRCEIAAALLHGPSLSAARRADDRPRRHRQGGIARSTSTPCRARTARPCC